jgi:transposase
MLSLAHRLEARVRHLSHEIVPRHYRRPEVLAAAARYIGDQLSELGAAVREQRALIERRTQYVTTIRGIGREYGLPLPSAMPKISLRGYVANRCRRSSRRSSTLVTLLETLEVQLFTVEQRLSALSAREPIIAQLTSTPSVGRIVAASFVSVIDDAHRFRNPHQVESYVGLVPSEDSSGGKRRIGAISKKGNSYPRALLVQSAWIILRAPNRVDPPHQCAGHRSAARQTHRCRRRRKKTSWPALGHVA